MNGVEMKTLPVNEEEEVAVTCITRNPPPQLQKHQGGVNYGAGTKRTGTVRTVRDIVGVRLSRHVRFVLETVESNLCPQYREIRS